MENFDLKKYLAENRLLKEEFVKGTPQYYVKYTTLDGKEVKSELMSKREAIYKERDLVDSGIKKSSVYKIQKNMDLNGKEYEIEYELDKDIEYRTDEEGKPIAENKLLKEEMSLEIDDDFIELTADSGTYDAYIEDDGTVDFSVTYEDDRDGEEFDEDNWKDILGPNHAFVKISNQIPTKVEAVDDYVMITVDVEDLKGIAD